MLRYEDLLDDGPRALARLGEFVLGRGAAAAAGGDAAWRARVDDALARSSFDAMRRSEEAAGTPLFDAHFPDARAARGFKLVRQGRAGAWGECFGARDDGDGRRARAAFAAAGGDAMLVELGYIAEGEEW